MAKIKMKPLEWVAYLLVSIGALNWGLDKVAGFNIVDWLLGLVNLAGYSIFVYGAVGLAGAYSLYKIWF